MFENLSTVDFSQVVRLERNLFSHDFRLSKERLYTKLEKLREESSMRNRIYSPRFTPGPGMVNLSSRTFETQEIETLEKGPKFSFLPKQVPVADIVSSLESALHKYCPSVSNPDEVRSCLINTLYNSQKKAKSPTTFTRKNLHDIKILSNLRKDPSIIITKADKSNSLVVMDTADYDNKIFSLLKDTSTYKPITHDPTDQFTNNIINELKQLKQNGKITPQLYNKFYPRGSFCPKFYGLPKLHKQGIPLRPIVACTKAPASNIGKWLCTAFKPLLYSQNSYISNSADLVKKLNNTSISENTIISSFDIVSMYTNIDVATSEQLLKTKIEENYHLIEDSATGIDGEVLFNLVKICNKFSMYFQFRDSFYQQINGLPMGAALSGLLANIYVENLENWALNSYFLKHVYWGRYMDDVISLWNYGETELRGFLDHLNTYDRNLQFTLEIEFENKLPFLDVLIIRNANNFDFTIYRKPTQNNRYLHFNSNHPPQVKRAVVTSLIDRALNICSDSYIKAEINFIRDILFGNGYPIPFVNNTINHRLKRHFRKINDISQCEAPEKPSNIIYLPYIPRITTKIKNICTKNNLYLVFTNNFKITNFLNSGKDKTPVTRQRGVYQIPCDCGNYYVGRTHQNLEKRIHQHKEDIDKALIANNSNNSFDSALASHIFDNPSHTILFEKSSLISSDLGIKQVVRESIEIRLKINKNISLNRDLGEYSLNSLYSNLIKNDLTKYFIKPIDNSIEPVTKRPLRLAAKKARLALKTCS